MTTNNGSGLMFRRYLLRLVIVAIVAAVFYYGDEVRRTSTDLPGPNEAPTGPAVSDSEATPSLEIDEKNLTTSSTPPVASRKSKEPTPDKQPGSKQSKTEQTKTAKTKSEQTKSRQSSDSLVMRGLVLRDESGDVLYKGDIDLKPTIDRVAAGDRLRFRNDGSTFQNREGRLPRKSTGYYREWVVPTPGDDGPGPQRLVTGKDGEVWYTPDHYRSFRRIPYKLP